jgi:hypothetical protein
MARTALDAFGRIDALVLCQLHGRDGGRRRGE